MLNGSVAVVVMGCGFRFSNSRRGGKVVVTVTVYISVIIVIVTEINFSLNCKHLNKCETLKF